jgi:hypothetical protein
MTSLSSRLVVRASGLLLAATAMTYAHFAWSVVPVVSSGTIYLNLGSQNKFYYGATTQPVNTGNGNSCALIQDMTPKLVKIDTEGGTPGFNSKKAWFGVQEKSQGVDCGRVSATSNQKLTLTLSGQVAGALVVKTDVALNAKKNAVIVAELLLNGVPIGRSFTFKSGASAPVGNPAPFDTTYCSPGVSDSNPDSNADCRWVFPNLSGVAVNGIPASGNDAPAQWNGVRFTAMVGEFGLGGPNSISTFQIAVAADGELGCPGGNNTFEAIGNGIVYQGTRLYNRDVDLSPDAPPVPDECHAVPYVVSTSCPTGSTATQCTNLVYDFLDQGSYMAFYFRWIWAPEPTPTAPSGGTIVNSIAPTQQYFLNGSTLTALDFCPGVDWLFDDNGTPDDPTDDIFLGPAAPLPASLDKSSAPGTQAGCLVTRQVIQDGLTVQAIEGAYVQGDYGAIRF